MLPSSVTAGHSRPSVAQAIPDLLSVVDAAEETGENPGFGRQLIDPSGRSLESIFQVLSKFLVSPNQMFLDEVKVVCDIGRAADPIASHAYRACV
jgi:hypothetical protein